MLRIIILFIYLISNCSAYNKFINNYVFTWTDKDKSVVENYLLKSSNNPDSSYILGTLYLEGEILQKDNKKANYYISKAANLNLPEAINSIGNGYYLGDIREKNIKKALEFYEKAAKLGFGPAQFNAGIVFLKNGKTKKDIKKAIFWLDKASKNSNDLECLTKSALSYKKDAENKLLQFSKNCK